ncbi:MAG: hypothetical protein P1Q69_02280 [Candidatus Thorarchaeota archaeon]|nr:hypothetical protein [Candidatus Thorarchaeota archaeon]
MYTFSTIGREFLVYNVTPITPPWWELDADTVMIIMITVGGAGGAILIIVLIIKLRKPGDSIDFSYG